MRLGVKIAVAFALAFLLIGAVGVWSYLGMQRLSESSQWVTHTHEVMESLEHVLSALKDAETGQRGFVLTGEERYLQPCAAATGEIKQDIDKVASLTADNPDQQQNIGQLRNLAADKLAELQETIKLQREEKHDQALQVIRSDRGEAIMDEVRALIDKMESRERTLLDKRNRDAGEAATQTTQQVGLGALLSVLVLAVAALIITRTMRLAAPKTLPTEAGTKWPRAFIRYAFAVAIVALATLLRWWLDRQFGTSMPTFLTFYPAVLLAASIAGGGPGVLATILCALAADYWFVYPFHSFTVTKAGDAVALGIFVGTGIFVSLLMERLRRARYAEAVSVTQERELALLNMGNVLIKDMDHRIVRWSEGNHRLYGFDFNEAIGQSTHDLLKTHFTQPLEQIHGELQAKGFWEGEATREAKDGTKLSLAILWALRRGEAGEPPSILEVSTDITKRKRAQEALRETEHRLRTILDTLPVAIFLSDKDGNVIFTNPAVERFWGISTHVTRDQYGQYKGTWVATGKPVEPEQWALAQTLVSGKPFTNDLVELTDSQGKKRIIHNFAIPIHDDGGKISGAVVVTEDITERYAAQEQIRLAKEAAEHSARDLARSNQDLEQFAYVSSHDLQEPLRMVSAFMQLLEQRYKDKLDAEGAKYVHYAVDGAKRMQSLINDLLAYSRVGTKGGEPEPVDCRQVLEQAMANLKVSLEESNAKVTHGPLPIVNADQRQLSQLFQNLLGNAIKFRSDRPLEIHVQARRDGDFWVFGVSDNGIGMEEQHRERIFVIFQRLHPKEKYPGTGIGLAICKKIVERHGGQIWVQSQPGKGSTFYFKLPA
jgi:PAS domain S-box-containing protein